MAEELHQEFLLRLCEIGINKLTDVSDYIDWFCLDVINKIWLNRNRVKAYETGSTNPLFEFSGSIQTEGYVFEDTMNFDFDYHYKEAKQIIEKDIQSSDIDLNCRARVFTYTMGLNIKNGLVEVDQKYKNARQFSVKSGVGYDAVCRMFRVYKQYLKEKLIK